MVGSASVVVTVDAAVHSIHGTLTGWQLALIVWLMVVIVAGLLLWHDDDL